MREPGWLDAFIERRRLPARFRDDAREHLAPVADWLAHGTFTTVGLSGAQGTGKTTLGAFLVEALRADFGRQAVLLSLDDFYLARHERESLASTVHPLLATRGVPGTHDIARLHATLDALAKRTGTVRVPAFDKARDDRLPDAEWRRIDLPVDLVILEGWCVGVPAQTRDALEDPVNSLERDRDPTGAWRRFVNDHLKKDYAALNSRLDALVYIEAPGMEAVLRWRTQQEHELIADRGEGMSDTDVADFVRHYERVTLRGLRSLPSTADVVIELDAVHGVSGVRFNRDETHES